MALDDGQAIHATLIRDGQPQPNPRQVDPVAFLNRGAVPPEHPLQAATPTLQLRDPGPARARGELRRSTHNPRLDPHTIEAVVHGLSETVTNAHQYGTPPVTVRVWVAGARLLATVHDTGTGPADPYAGLVRAQRNDADGDGGYGLWLVHQMCDEVVHFTDHTDFTIRITAGPR